MRKRALIGLTAMALASGCGPEARVTPASPTPDPLEPFLAAVIEAGAAIDADHHDCPEDRSLVQHYNDAVRAYNAEAQRLGLETRLPRDTTCD